MTAEERIREIEAELDRLDAERLKVRERARTLMAERHRLIQEDNAAAHGLKAEDYAKVKAAHDPKQGSLAAHLSRVRRTARDVQAVKADAAEARVKVKK